MCVGLALAMLAMAAIHLTTPPTLVDLDVVLRFGTAVFALALAPFVVDLDPVLVSFLLSAALVLQVVLELSRHDHHHHHGLAEPLLPEEVT